MTDFPPVTRTSAIPAEKHFVSRIGWLRAAVLGANDGIVSTASLIVGVAASSASQREILIAGAAGLVAGAMSMAAGEYVSVSSQSDTENADLAKEGRELKDDPAAEMEELAQIYVARGLDYNLAMQVAVKLSANDVLKAHARDELGISDFTTARPIQAAFTSAATFSVGAALPLAMAFLFSVGSLPIAVSVASLVFLAILGALGARVGGASAIRGALRVAFWGCAAMALTALIGSVFGTAMR